MLISLAFYSLQAVLPETRYKNPNFLGGCTVLNESIGAEPGWGVFSEAILTFILVLTVLTTVANEKHCQLAPLCIGFSVVVTSSAGYQIFTLFDLQLLFFFWVCFPLRLTAIMEPSNLSTF